MRTSITQRMSIAPRLSQKLKLRSMVSPPFPYLLALFLWLLLAPQALCVKLCHSLLTLLKLPHKEESSHRS
jgi:hypothetical protein